MFPVGSDCYLSVAPHPSLSEPLLYPTCHMAVTAWPGRTVSLPICRAKRSESCWVPPCGHRGSLQTKRTKCPSATETRRERETDGEWGRRKGERVQVRGGEIEGIGKRQCAQLTNFLNFQKGQSHLLKALCGAVKRESKDDVRGTTSADLCEKRYLYRLLGTWSSAERRGLRASSL
ncbi:hypothetical protein DPEC_G00336920 [Dallia pectoralis]|uniref:Uncharacterized protein n=1 Tax=Dallia pectoralis TaxID=75939 RepID=A0ACC2F798_DALPE|nr:hypothetical protein DPEC_G00336920 [Dallia pectoralis]